MVMQVQKVIQVIRAPKVTSVLQVSTTRHTAFVHLLFWSYSRFGVVPLKRNLIWPLCIILEQVYTGPMPFLSPSPSRQYQITEGNSKHDSNQANQSFHSVIDQLLALKVRQRHWNIGGGVAGRAPKTPESRRRRRRGVGHKERLCTFPENL